MAAGGDYKDFIELTKNLTDSEREAFRLEALERANGFLLANKATVEAVTERLMERGQIDGSEFIRLTRDA
jgi:ATP-dependent Zn protease